MIGFRAHHAEKGALAGIRHSDNAHVCHQLQLQVQPKLGARLTMLRQGRGVVAPRLEAGVAAAATCTRQEQCPLAWCAVLSHFQYCSRSLNPRKVM